MRGSAKQSVKDRLPYGNKEILTPHCTEATLVVTMKLSTFDYVGKTNTLAKFGLNQGISYMIYYNSLVSWGLLRAYVNYTLLVTFFLPYCLPAFFLAHLHWPNG